MAELNNLKKESITITTIYILAGALYILLSDKIVGLLVTGKDMITLISIVKGWAYVAASGILIFVLVYNALKRIKATEDKLLKSCKELTTAKDEMSTAYEQLAASEAMLRQQYDESLKNQQQLLEYKEKLHFLAYHDQLTGIDNRLSLIEMLTEFLNGNNGNKCAILFVDIDNFKYVNDTMGHSFGDRLLKEISDMLVCMLDKNCSVYRLGGDEFVVLIEDFYDIYEIEKTAVKILKELKNPVEIDGRTFFSTVSIGISLYPDHGSTMDELLKNADIAVYKAKEMGKNRIAIYNEPMNIAVAERMNIEKYLRTALENNEFELYYQPQLDIQTNQISGFEALLRWRNAELGFVMPAKFISIAENTHLIIPIGEWVLRNACLFLKRIQQSGHKNLMISINVSMLQLLQDDFVDVVTEILELANLKPGYLEIEITESILMESYEAIAEKLKLLKAKGVKIALDDFGKGYSSLNYLRHLPISTLKIDKSFIDTISSGKESQSMIDLIVKIGKSMDLCVVAEGVETQEQLDYLVIHKCNKMQGYLYSRPLPETEAIRKLSE